MKRRASSRNNNVAAGERPTKQPRLEQTTTTTRLVGCVEDKDGTKRWYSPDGLLHRATEPAVEYPSGTVEYWVDGKRHRVGGEPAIERANGGREYWVDGELHRDNGEPAIMRVHGPDEYWIKGKRHRSGGLPAVVWPANARKFDIDGFLEWWADGKYVRCAGVSARTGTEYPLPVIY